ncbi:hypothetical protein COLO4_06544 [Corchorus olitorius]|uniref:Uncharacterized protein n=1 Tax=Corchorus olitorius TaxID=93759 RepID=A0A1R3KMR4_9ROSI|nr:hypothetical protein COLO4_06544 [Corchorus olitorius]
MVGYVLSSAAPSHMPKVSRFLIPCTVAGRLGPEGDPSEK